MLAIERFTKELAKKGLTKGKAEDLRRKLITHKVTIAAKQVVQLQEIFALERMIHLIMEAVDPDTFID